RRWLLPDEMGKRDTESNFALGLHIPGAFQKVIDIDACLLQKEDANNILFEVKRFARHSGIPVYNLKTHSGIWRFLTIRYSRAFERYMVNIVTSEDISGSISPLIDTLNNRFKNVATVVNNITRKKAAVAVGEKELVLKGDGYLEDKIGDFTFQISANSFFQTNTRAAEKLYQKAAEFADLKGDETVLDLYSGTGTVPVFLSGRAKDITGMEISTSAILDAQKNCRANGVDNCRFVLGDIRKQLSSMTVAPDVIIIDPPRAGMHRDVLNQVLTLSAKTIVYISCNPATLARDIGIMAQAYEVAEIQPVDMFPHTYHVEAVAKLHFRKTIAR
ncbi:MAG: 23S rRNA (uracil(1939)-C(5))-methyltransferase RlmD, partial [Deltaproteobacteria bacterium]|nr:23S rRNA (uracil(1939)-C(5))-methyltransferase RlmD [Deltaproteobacteria bacterium]